MRWKSAGKMYIVADPVKLEIKAIKSTKCGIKIAGRRVESLLQPGCQQTKQHEVFQMKTNQGTLNLPLFV